VKGLILVGGLGTRLGAEARGRPKALMKVAGRPFLEYLILQLRKAGVLDVVLCTGYLGDQIEQHFRRGSAWGVHISYSRDPYPLGTGGAIRRAADAEAERFLVMNGDSFLGIDLNALINYHCSIGAMATMGLVEVVNGTSYGSVQIDANGAVKRFEEKGEVRGTTVVNGGVYVFEGEVIKIMPGGAFSLESEFLPRLVREGRLFGMVTQGFFVDIGTPTSLSKLAECPRPLLDAVE